jgi:hypothetical protein
MSSSSSPYQRARSFGHVLADAYDKWTIDYQHWIHLMNEMTSMIDPSISIYGDCLITQSTTPFVYIFRCSDHQQLTHPDLYE